MSTYSSVVVLSTNSIVEDFIQEIRAPFSNECQITEENLLEVLRQICMIHLNDEPVESVKKLPDFSRFRLGDMLLDPSLRTQFGEDKVVIHIQASVVILAENIQRQFLRYGICNDNNWEIDYYFDHLLGYDIVMGHIPY